MMEKSLTDAKNYFDLVVELNVADFIENPSTFRLAFNAASALFHQHEWLFESKKAELERFYSQSFENKGKFWKHIENSLPEASYIRDLANASKHIKLTIQPSTSMCHIANTVIRTSTFGTGAYGVGRYSNDSIVMQSNGQDIYLDDCIQKLRDFWHNLIQILYVQIV